MLLGVLWRNHALTCNAALRFCLTVERVGGTKGWKSLSLEFLNYFSTTGDHWRQSCSKVKFIGKFWLEISLLLKFAVRFARIEFWPQFSKKFKCAWVLLLLLDTCFSISLNGVMGVLNVWCHWKNVHCRPLLGHQVPVPSSLDLQFPPWFCFCLSQGLDWNYCKQKQA